MKNLWYVSVASASTAAAPRRMHDVDHLDSALRVRRCSSPCVVLACAGLRSGAPDRQRPAGRRGPAAAPGAAIEKPGARDANLAGARCKGGGALHLPQPSGDAGRDAAARRATTSGSRSGSARVGGGATLDSPTLGHFAAGADEACFYIDVLPGTTSDVTFTAPRRVKEGGRRPVLDIAEYGPKGPWWYDVLDVALRGAEQQVQPRRRRRVERGGQEPQARPRRPLRVVGDLAPHLGHVGRRRQSRARAVPRLHRRLHDGGEAVPDAVPPRATECVPASDAR